VVFFHRMPYQPIWYHPRASCRNKQPSSGTFSRRIHTTQSSFLFNSEARPFWLLKLYDCGFTEYLHSCNIVALCSTKSYYCLWAFDLLFHSCLGSFLIIFWIQHQKVFSFERMSTMQWPKDDSRRGDICDNSQQDWYPSFFCFHEVRMFVEPSAWLLCDVVTSLRSLRTSSYVMESIDWSCWTVPLERITLVVDLS